MNEAKPELVQAMRAAANRLHHLSMRYVGAFVELAKEKPVAFVAQDHPGRRETRDLIDLILFVRAEVNALTALLLEAKILDIDTVTKRFADEYQWFCEQKAQTLGVGVNDAGLVYNFGPGKN